MLVDVLNGTLPGENRKKEKVLGNSILTNIEEIHIKYQGKVSGLCHSCQKTIIGRILR